MSFQLRYSQYNERSILIEWPVVIDEETLKDVLFFKEVIEVVLIKESVELISAYNSILVVMVMVLMMSIVCF